ncbi:MAG TPA: hypothetical protein VHF25_11955 [Nitriliruptorales bacterium]|nr:hypothetical protein [Nitriliruptorales bacterium]
MRIDELAFVCEEAARDLAARERRPLPPAVVLPGPQRTRVVTLPDFPDDDRGRHALLQALAADEIVATSTPAYGFLAEGELEDGNDVLVIVYGAQGHSARITAAPLGDDGALGAFSEPEPLAPEAMPFLHPLQDAVGSARQAPPATDVLGLGRETDRPTES